MRRHGYYLKGTHLDLAMLLELSTCYRSRHQLILALHESAENVPVLLTVTVPAALIWRLRMNLRFNVHFTAEQGSAACSLDPLPVLVSKDKHWGPTEVFLQAEYSLNQQ